MSQLFRFQTLPSAHAESQRQRQTRPHNPLAGSSTGARHQQFKAPRRAGQHLTGQHQEPARASQRTNLNKSSWPPPPTPNRSALSSCYSRIEAPVLFRVFRTARELHDQQYHEPGNPRGNGAAARNGGDIDRVPESVTALERGAACFWHRNTQQIGALRLRLHPVAHSPQKDNI